MTNDLIKFADGCAFLGISKVAVERHIRDAARDLPRLFKIGAKRWYRAEDLKAYLNIEGNRGEASRPVLTVPTHDLVAGERAAATTGQQCPRSSRLPPSSASAGVTRALLGSARPVHLPLHGSFHDPVDAGDRGAIRS